MPARFLSKSALRLTALSAAALLAASVSAAQARADADQGSAWLARAMAAQEAPAPAAQPQAETQTGAPASSAEAWAPRAVQAGLRPAWMEERFSLSIQEHPLGEVLSEFAAAAGAPLRLSEGAPKDALVSGRFEDVSGAEFLDRLARDNGLDWRQDGGVIEVSGVGERVTRLAALKGVSVVDLERTMRRLGIWEDKFRPKVVDGALAHINAPPRYVASLEVVLEEMVAARAQAQAEAEAAQAQAEAEAAKAEAAREAEQVRLKAEYEAQQAKAKAEAEARQARLDAEARERAWRAAQPPRVVRGGAWN
ncbi:hypothetical protein [Neomegalonema perideroedes]|uniref:hypothetical protein n=1 Tax=Neomegalonema perideroedes TaxID=217219 RepID=UPI000372718C|nr:hypothetical protein [Neomegalonema perideroedes]